ncbi:carboxypeptidase regulatory-like domain-containing protein [Oxalobacteraceae bacterium]|nr:carboxypeptidase regulatory-like domain-containing protein [Oxalobacteraceae bacterium]
MVRRLHALQKTSLTITAIVLLGCVYLAFSNIWYSPAIEARLVTPQGDPVAGAIIVAGWNIEGPWNGSPRGQLAVAEVLSDKDGKFNIPAWGPRRAKEGHIRIDEPTLRIYRPGYLPLVIKNYEDVPMRSASHILQFRLQGKNIVLQPFQGPLPEYEVALTALLDSLSNIYSQQGPGTCYWRDTPRILLALQDLKWQLSPLGGGNSLRKAYEYANTKTPPQCGDAFEFFRDFKRP